MGVKKLFNSYSKNNKKQDGERRKTPDIELTRKQKKHLEKIKNGSNSRKHHIQRATIILLANEGMNNSQIARACNCCRNIVIKWINRWADAQAFLAYIKKEFHYEQKASIMFVLEDAPRSGRPQTFTPEQIAEIIKVACRRLQPPRNTLES